jgi:hypothetical protein
LKDETNKNARRTITRTRTRTTTTITSTKTAAGTTNKFYCHRKTINQKHQKKKEETKA